MDVLLASEITADMIVSSNAPLRLSGQVQWVQQAWPAGSVVTRESVDRVFRAAYAVPDTVGPPEEDMANNQIPYWTDAGPMNQMGMFDSQLKTQTIGPEGNLIVKLQPGAISNLWLGNISNATAVQVIGKNGTDGPIIYDERRELAGTVTTWWDWWFAPFTLIRDAYFQGIPAYRNLELTIILETEGTAAIGMSALGVVENLGETDWGVDADFKNYSARNLNQTWGPTQATGGEVTKDISYHIHVDAVEAPRVDQFMKKAMKRPAIFIPDNQVEYEGIRIFGQAMTARMNYPYYNYVTLDMTVREFL